MGAMAVLCLGWQAHSIHLNRSQRGVLAGGQSAYAGFALTNVGTHERGTDGRFRLGGRRSEPLCQTRQPGANAPSLIDVTARSVRPAISVGSVSWEVQPWPRDF